MSKRDRHQRAVVELGFQALSHLSFPDLLDVAVRAIAEALDPRTAWIAEAQPDGHLFVRAGLGLEDGPVGALCLGADAASLSSHTLLAGRPVASDDLLAERRLTPAPSLMEDGAQRAVCVVIGSRESRYGVLGATAREPHHFTSDDVGFLQAVANMLAAAVQRVEAEQAARVKAEQYESMLAASSDAFFLLAPTGRIVDLNDGYCGMSGYDREDLLELSISDLDAQMTTAEIEQIVAGVKRDRFARFETRHRAKDGHLFVVEVSVSYCPGQDHFVTFVRDIGDRTSAEADLRHMRDMLDRAQEVSKVGGWEYDIASGQTTWTDEALRIIGLERGTGRPNDAEEAIARVDEASRPGVVAAFEQAVAGGEPFDLEIPLTRADGERIWVRLIAKPVIEDGRPVLVVGTFADITAKKLAELREERVTRLYRVLAAVNEAIMRAHDRSELLRAVCEVIVRDGGLATAKASVRAEAIELMAQAGRIDVRGDPDGLFALKCEGAVVGELSVYADTPGDFDAEELRLFDGLAADVSFGLTALDRERRRLAAEEELRVSEELFRGGFEHSPIAQWLTSLDGTLRQVNSAFARMFGHDDPGELVGASLAALTHEDDRSALEEARRAMADDAGTYSAELRGIRRDGTVVQIQVAATLVRDAEGEPLVVFGQGEDITDRRRSEQELRLRAELLDLAHDAVIVRDPVNGRVTFWNREARAMYGYSSAEAIGRNLPTLLATAFPESQAAVEEALAREGRWVGELRHTRKDGEVILVASRQAMQREPDGRPVAIIELNSDITAQRQAEESSRRLAAIVQSTPDAVVATDLDGLIVEWNRGSEDLFGYMAAEVIGQSMSMLVDPDLAAQQRARLQEVIAGGEVDQLEAEALRKDGARIPVSVTISPIYDAGGQIVGAAAIHRDVSERKRHEGELAYLADHDSLTGLFNRRRFQEELERELARARRDRSGGALLVVDLDHFKAINDSLGHHLGDQVIAQAGEIFLERLRETDVIGRPGGDEFAVLLRDVDASQASLVAAGLLDALRAECKIDAPSGIQRVTASVGIAPFGSADELAADDLIVEADIAMYEAKAAGRDQAMLYKAVPERQRPTRTSVVWSERIRNALEHDLFVLDAQPIVPFHDEAHPRFELLVRMLSADGTTVPPATFLYVAERMDLIKQIDRWVLHRAITSLGGAQRAGSDPRLHVNLSAHSINDPGLPQLIADELGAADANGNGLCLEITETTAIVNLPRARRLAARINELGCELALDDFGAGYASFHYLKHLAFDYLKIDGEFIQNLTHNPTDHLVVQTLVSIAKALDKCTIAEYVGDHETLELLRSYGVDYGQGFHLGRPMPLDQTDVTASPTIPRL